MANFGLTDIAAKMIFPTNRVIMDDVGMPGIYYYHGAQALSALLTGGDSSIHPAFLVDGVQKNGIYIGKFQGCSHNNRIYSLPAEDPRAVIDLDTYETYCRNKGAGHHCITAAEWAFLALWCKKNATLPYGNNNYGKDSRETQYLAIPTTASSGQTNRVATGTGPLKWAHNWQLDGIFDLNGNVWEWVSGLRLVSGELQVIPYNNAANKDNPTGVSSNLWRAIKADATSYEDLFIVPDGTGTTAGSVKLDYVSNHWQWDTAITSQSDTSRNATFQSTTCAAGIGTFTRMYLEAMALCPESGDTGYDSDYFYANNGAAERCASRGGDWGTGVSAGVFSLYLYNPRSNAHTYFGGRPAFYE